MTSTFTTTPLTLIQYETLLAELLESVEGNSVGVYLDSDGIPTIGIGWNLRVDSNMDDFLEQILGIMGVRVTFPSLSWVEC